MAWLPPDFQHPARLDLPGGEHLRPIRAADIDLDYPAVMGSRDRLWGVYGDTWGWPPETMSVEEDAADLARHEEEMVRGLSFNYAIFDADEVDLLGCVYIDPPDPPDPPDRPDDDHGAAAVVSWWVIDRAVGSRLEADLAEAVPRWLAEAWPFADVRFGV